MRRTSSINGRSAANLATVLQASDAGLTTPSDVQAGASLPNYIRALPSALDADVVEFLHKRGALTLPRIELRNQLLQNYVQYVHPYMPSIDLEEFLQSIESNDASNQVSLMLFHAVMFAATAFVKLPLLKAEGYNDRKTARRNFFQKAKVRYQESLLYL